MSALQSAMTDRRAPMKNQKSNAEKNVKTALERWENEGGEILGVPEIETNDRAGKPLIVIGKFKQSKKAAFRREEKTKIKTGAKIMKTQPAKTQTANGQIEPNQWKKYLADFTSRNANRPARLVILGDEIGAGEEAEHLPFMMASFEEKGSDAGDALLTLGGANAAAANRIMHVVKGVISITPQIESDGSESALEIAGAEEKAILAFE